MWHSGDGWQRFSTPAGGNGAAKVLLRKAETCKHREQQYLLGSVQLEDGLCEMEELHGDHWPFPALVMRKTVGRGKKVEGHLDGHYHM